MKTKLLILAFCMVLSACKGEDPAVDPEPEPQKAFFAKGGDISWITEMEEKGYTFQNSECTTMECTALLNSIGFNSVRYRVWVNPENGWNSKEDVLVKARRAQALGMKIMIDFHYSDWWADPGKQNVPEAWKGLGTQAMAEAVAEHTRDVLNYLKSSGIVVDWVQVGNEVTNGMLWESGRVKDRQSMNFVNYFNAGASAVHEIFQEAKVILHLDNAWKLDTLTWFLDLVKSSGINYDVLGLSLYPSYWDSAKKKYPDWRYKTELCVSNLKTLHDKYAKPVMLCEFGMPASLPEESRDALQYIIDNTSGFDWFGGIFLWEPESEKSRNNYDYGAFEGGKPTIALQPFNTKK